MILAKLIRLYHTLYYLHASQIFWRVYYRLIKPRIPRANPALKPASRQGLWIGPPVKANSFGASSIKLLHQSAPYDALGAPWHMAQYSALWNYHLHYFEGLMAADISVKTAKEMLDKWVVQNPPIQGVGWDAYPISRRACYWMMAAQRMPDLLDDAAIQSLNRQMHALHGRIEYHLQGNHLLANAKALFIAGVFFSGNQALTWRKKGIALYEKELPKQFLSFGAHGELSPMYHALMVEDLLDCANIAKRYDVDIPASITHILPKALAYLQHVTRPDGSLASFNDSAQNIAPSSADLLRYAAALGFVPDADFSTQNAAKNITPARLQSDDWCVLFDVGDVGLDYQPGHAHADHLTFELAYKNQLMIANTGTSEYGLSQRRAHERSTSAHNTLVLDGKNSSDVWASFRVGKRAKISQVRVDAQSASAMHDGYAPVMHRRSITINENNVYIEDWLTGSGRHNIAIMLHFTPDISVEETRLMLPDNTAFDLSGYVGLQCSVSPYEYASEFGHTQPAQQLCYRQLVSLPWHGVLKITLK
jgi:uncharacterized heparinase superfamily protein